MAVRRVALWPRGSLAALHSAALAALLLACLTSKLLVLSRCAHGGQTQQPCHGPQPHEQLLSWPCCHERGICKVRPERLRLRCPKDLGAPRFGSARAVD